MIFEGKEYYTIDETEQITALKQSTIKSYCHAKKIEHILLNRKIFISKTSLEEYINTKKRPVTPTGYYTVEETAKLVGVRHKTIYEKIKRNYLKTITVKNQMFVSKDNDFTIFRKVNKNMNCIKCYGEREQQVLDLILDTYESVKEFATKINMSNLCVRKLLEQGIEQTEFNSVMTVCADLGIDPIALYNKQIIENFDVWEK